MGVSAGGVLQSHPAFAEWSSGARNALLQRARRLGFEPGDVLFRAGEPGNSLFVVLEGVIRVSLTTPEGLEVFLAEAGPGAVIGEMALLDPAPRSATAVALAGGSCLWLSHDDLEDLLWDDASLASALLDRLARILAARVEQTDRMAGDIREEAARSGQYADEASAEVWRLLWTGAA